MNRRQKLTNRIERAVLTAGVLGVAFVLEQALERMTAGQERPRSKWGQALLRRLMPSAHVKGA